MMFLECCKIRGKGVIERTMGKGQWKVKVSCVIGKLSEFVIVDQGMASCTDLQYGAEPTIPQIEKEVGASLRPAGSERC